MELIKLKDESQRVRGIVAEGDIDEIRFVRYFVKFGVYQYQILEEGVQLDDVFSPDMLEKTIQEEREIRRENIRRLAEKRFPQEKRIYYQEMF